MNNSLSKYEAKEPSLGYIYQIYYALWLLIYVGRNNIDAEVTIEGLDDVVVIEDNNLRLNQVKYHAKPNSLTDRDSDFWKTIRIWSEEIAQNTFKDDASVTFVLTTTAKVSETTFIHKLCSPKRSKEDIDGILSAMKDIAKKASNHVNESGYTAFCALTEAQQKQLVKNICVIGNNDSVENICSEIRKMLFSLVNITHLDDAIQTVFGWWQEQCCNVLLNKQKIISYRSFANKLDLIRDTYSLENLPDSFDTYDLTDDDTESMENEIFIRQLNLIALGKHQIRIAMSHFKRAYFQRAKWINDANINPEELEQYDKRLYHHWEDLFAECLDAIEDEKNNPSRQRFLQQIYVEHDSFYSQKLFL